MIKITSINRKVLAFRTESQSPISDHKCNAMVAVESVNPENKPAFLNGCPLTDEEADELDALCARIEHRIGDQINSAEFPAVRADVPEELKLPVLEEPAEAEATAAAAVAAMAT